MSVLKDMLDATMIRFIIDFPTYAQLATRVGIHTVKRPEIPALAFTDGTGIYINESEFESLNKLKTMKHPKTGETISTEISKDNLVFVIAHELMHLLMLTYERGHNIGISSHPTTELQKKYNMLWNMATDYEINSLLINNSQADFGGSISHKPIGKYSKMWLYEEKYRDMTAEEIFEKLKSELKYDPSGNGGSDGNEGGGNGEPMDGGFKDAEGNTHSLDEHREVDEMTKSDFMGKAKEVFANGSGCDKNSTALNRAFNEAFKPIPFNWRKALTKYFKQFVKANYTWNKPSRAGISTGLILPSSGQTPSMRIGVAIDTSGSISEADLQDLMNHVFTLLSQFKSFEINLFCVSTKVHEETLMTLTPTTKKNLVNFKIASNGGTELKTAFPYIEKQFAGKPLDLLLYMTDGEDYDVDGSETLTAPCPVVWLICGNHDFKRPKKIRGEVYKYTRNNS